MSGPGDDDPDGRFDPLRSGNEWSATGDRRSGYYYGGELGDAGVKHNGWSDQETEDLADALSEERRLLDMHSDLVMLKEKADRLRVRTLLFGIMAGLVIVATFLTSSLLYFVSSVTSLVPIFSIAAFGLGCSIAATVTVFRLYPDEQRLNRLSHGLLIAQAGRYIADQEELETRTVGRDG